MLGCSTDGTYWEAENVGTNFAESCGLKALIMKVVLEFWWKGGGVLARGRVANTPVEMALQAAVADCCFTLASMCIMCVFVYVCVAFILF